MKIGALEKIPLTTIRFNDINYSVPRTKNEKKLILKSVSGEFRSGELTAIMGPSGAGKTTLMSVLAGFKISNATGDVIVNKKIRNLKTFRKSSCLITQRDELCPVLTVAEYMKYAADIKIGGKLCTKEKQKLIYSILDAIGISHCVDTRAANLSGGEKKRLAISLELISNPQIMFFDEPTTGLDSLTCFQCVSILKSLAQEGRAIICVIHQPSSSIFEMFDQLYLLADGQCIFQGPTANVISSIEKTTGLVCPIYHSAADFAIDVAVHNYGSDAVDKLIAYGQQAYDETAQLLDHQMIHEDCTTSYAECNHVSKWTQFRVILKKTSTCILRDLVLTKLRGFVAVFSGILTGLLFLGIGNESSHIITNFKLIFFIQAAIVLTSLVAVVLTFPLERKVLLREYLNRWYRLDMYYLAKTVADLPFEILHTSAFVTIVYFMTNQPFDAERFFKFLSFAVLVGLIAQSMGIAIGAALNLKAAIFIGPPTVIPFGLFCGALIRFKDIPSYMQWICSLSFMRCGFVGKIISIYDIHRPHLQCSEEFCYFKAPVKLLQYFNMDNDVYWINFTALFGFFLLIRGLAYFVLLWKLKSKL